MASIDGFLTTYFKQLHFNSMSPEVRARWAEYMKLPDLNWSMKDWRRELMHETAPESGEYVNFDLPNIEEGKNQERVDAGLKDPGLTDDQIRDLYKYMNAAVSGMAEDKKLNNTEFATAKAFVNDFYGEFEVGEPPVKHANVFNIIKVSSDTNDKLQEIIKQPNGALQVLKAPVEKVLEHMGGEKKLTFDKLIEKIQKGDYDKDSAFREQLITLFENIESYAPYSWLEYTPDGINYPNKNALYNFTGNLRDKLVDGLRPEPSNDSIERFKHSYGDILERIYKKPKVKALFAEHDSNGIISALDNARADVNYDVADQPNYLYPKTEKHLNVPQQLKKKIDDFYENNLEKYFNNFGGDRLFKSKPARDIVKGINKAGIKRTDGLDAILNNADKIKKEIEHESTSTGSHFEWFLKEMKVIKDADEKAFAACLSHGVSLRGVVQRLIMDAVSAGKISEAKTALEILSVMKYENTTSKTLDAIKEDKELFNIFSNKDLSWNKNEGVKFVTGAMDKTIRVGGIAIATMATVAVNSIRKMGSKIRNENKDLAAAHNAKNKENQGGKTVLQDKLDKSTRNLAQKQKEHDAFVMKYGDKDKIEQNYVAAQTSWTNLIDNIKSRLLPDLIGYLTEAKGTDEEMGAVEDFVNKYNDYINGGENLPDISPYFPEGIKQTAKDIRILLKSTKRDLEYAQEKKQKFTNAANTLKSAEDELAANQKKLDSWDDDHKDKYQELINYWNELEKGRDIHLGRIFGGMYSRWGNKKTQQEAYFAKYSNGIPPR